MSLERRTIIDQIEIQRDGIVQVRLAKQIVDGGEVLRSEFHRVAMAPGADLGASVSLINANLEELREATVADAEWDRVRRVIGREHTPEVIAAFEEKAPAVDLTFGEAARGAAPT